MSTVSTLSDATGPSLDALTKEIDETLGGIDKELAALDQSAADARANGE